MADVFLSYARSDEAYAAALAMELSAEGYKVWWDRRLSGGSEFTKEIEDELSSAGTVLVIWSANAIQSHWVRDEASVGRDAGKLLPIRIDESLPPMGFRQVHTIDCSGRQADELNFAQILSALKTMRGEPGQASEQQNFQEDLRTRTYPDNTIAVLPFSDLSAERDQAYLGEGVAEEILNALVKGTPLKVTGRGSAFSLAGRGLEAQDIGQELKVAHLLQGSVRKQANLLRITAHLTQVEDGFEIWSEIFDGTVDDVFDLQDRIARAVVDALELVLDVAKVRLAANLTRSPEAYEVFLRGRGLAQQQENSDALVKAIDYLKRATELDPEFALAWAWLGNTHFFFMEHCQPSDWRRHSREGTDAARKSLRLQPDLPDAHLAMSYVHLLELNFDKQFDARQRAYDLDPASVAVVHEYGSAFASKGDTERALEFVLKSVEDEPFSPSFAGFVGSLQWALGNTREALAGAEKTVSLGSVLGVFTKAAILASEESGPAGAKYFLGASEEFRDRLPENMRPRLVRWLFAKAAFERKPWARWLMSLGMRKAVESDEIFADLNFKSGLAMTGQIELLFRSIREKPNPYLSGVISMFWLPDENARIARAHPDFPQLVEDIGLVRLWQGHGWPEYVQPLPGTDGSNLQFTCS